jgi:hypothetical protein
MPEEKNSVEARFRSRAGTTIARALMDGNGARRHRPTYLDLPIEETLERCEPG